MKWVTFENTQEAIIDKQTYDAVQKIREGRRRPTPMGEMNVFSGMVYCADCGKKMYLCRSSTMKQKEYFNCSSYRKQKKSTCTSHQITVGAIEEIVLSYLKRVSDFVIDHEGDFLDIAIQHSRLLSRKEVAKKASQVSEAENRIKALNKIIQSLYEDKVMGKIITPEIVRLLIDKVIVSEKVKTEDGYKRTVTICLTHVGEIELP